ncbi:MAG: UMP kinase [Deltaproteobacteria bacterium]|nr:UMP kinase [Deltaproteobacteria bacterium]
MDKLFYKKVLLKLSGEALLGKSSFGIDSDILNAIAEEVKEIKDLGVRIGIVIGGGNFFRGLQASSRGMERTSADYIGMLATVMNGLAIQNVFEKHGIPVRVQSALGIQGVTETVVTRVALEHMEKGRVVVFVGGTGNPFFTTDTAACLRALEIRAEVLLKATKVDGVYDKDPVKHSDARFFEHISYNEVMTRDLKVMDSTAISMCRDNNLPIVVFNLSNKGNIKDVVLGKPVGTTVGETR